MTSSLIVAAATGALLGMDGITWWCVVAFVALVIVLGADHHRRHHQPSLSAPIEHHHVTVLGPVHPLFDQDAA